MAPFIDGHLYFGRDMKQNLITSEVATHVVHIEDSVLVLYALPKTARALALRSRLREKCN
jgi:hypothetical protein